MHQTHTQVCALPIPYPLIEPEPVKLPECVSNSQMGFLQHSPIGCSRWQYGGILLYTGHLEWYATILATDGNNGHVLIWQSSIVMCRGTVCKLYHHSKGVPALVSTVGFCWLCDWKLREKTEQQNLSKRMSYGECSGKPTYWNLELTKSFR